MDFSVKNCQNMLSKLQDTMEALKSNSKGNTENSSKNNTNSTDVDK